MLHVIVECCITLVIKCVFGMEIRNLVFSPICCSHMFAIYTVIVLNYLSKIVTKFSCVHVNFYNYFEYFNEGFIF